MPTKTIETRLSNHSSNKRRKLSETRREYNQALQDTFFKGCETQSVTNDVVVQYGLSDYMKNAVESTFRN